MMNVKEYANEMDLTVAEVLKKCKELDLKVTDATSMLSDDDIILLDNTLNLISSDDELDFDEEEELEEKVEDIVSNIKLDVEEEVRKEKIKKKPDFNSSKEEYKTQKKQMYKNKEKLISNIESSSDIVLYTQGMKVSELASQLNVDGAEIIKKLMELGLMLTLNHPIDYDNAEIIVAYYNKQLKREETQDITNFEEFEVVDDEEHLVKRAPVITIMGHVDHGKTSLLDYIRNSHVTEKESGGITQHIGAYQIEYNDEKLTFIDTPGHAAFTEMRARGASITDIVIIIVAADDGVKPQTKEAIDHALAAKVPIIVAVNKIDKPGINVDKVLTEMAELNITPESWGGTYPFVNISAHTGEGIDELLETIVVIGEMLELKANPQRYALGTVVESSCELQTGCTATLLIQNGTLRIGDPIVAGHVLGHIRTMKDDLGKDIVEALPSMPVVITGINDNPSAGDRFMAFETESEAKKVAVTRQNQLKELKNKKEVINMDDLFSQIQSGIKEINVILKADVRGSEEAVKLALEKIDVDGVKIKVIRSDVGTITESDIVLANAGNAIVIGFNVIPSISTKEFAKSYGVEIRLYTIIYKLIEDMELAMQGMLDPEFEEQIIGHAEVRKLFKFSKVGTIAGSYITDGLIKNNSQIRIIRDSNVIGDTKIAQIQREKDQVREIKSGFECGITLANFNDLKEGDILEAYEMVEVKK
jgi:translation initiation factor IF-2